MGRIYMEFMAEYYGERYVEIDNPFGSDRLMLPFDFSVLKDVHFSVDLDAGAASYWSEIAAMQTLDNLLMQGKISTVEYLKRLPAGQITDKETLIAVLEREQQMQAMGMGGAIQGGAAPEAIAGEESPPLRGGPGYGSLQRIINQTGQVPQERGA